MNSALDQEVKGVRVDSIQNDRVIKAKGYYDVVWKGKRLESENFTPAAGEEKPEEDVADKKPVGPYHTLAERDDRSPFIQLVRGANGRTMRLG